MSLAQQALVISADLLERTRLRRILVEAGYEVAVTADLPAATSPPGEAYHLVLVNATLPGASSVEAVRCTEERWPEACRILLRTEDSSPELLSWCDDFLDSSLPEDFLRHILHRRNILDFHVRNLGRLQHSPRRPLRPPWSGRLITEY